MNALTGELDCKRERGKEFLFSEIAFMPTLLDSYIFFHGQILSISIFIHFNDFYESPETRVIVSVLDSEIIGLALFERKGMIGIFVPDSRNGKGIGCW